MDALLVILIIIPLMVAISIGVVFSLLKPPGRVRRERRRRMRELAERLGLRYYGRVEERTLSLLPHCSLFARGKARAVANLMGDDHRPPGRVLFDYEYGPQRSERGDMDMTSLFLVGMARAPTPPSLSRVQVHQSDLLGSPSGVPGLRRLLFENDPTFSTRFWIKNGSEEMIRGVLREPVRDALKRWAGRGPRPVVEMLPGWVVVYVESDPADREVARRAAAVLRYATGVAASFEGVPAR